MSAPGTPRYFCRQVDAAKRFHLRLRTEKGVQIESAGREDCAAFYNVDRDRFRACVVEFIRRGVGRIQLGEQEWTLLPGSLYAYDRRLPHRLASSADAGMTKYFVALRGSGVRALLARHGIVPGRVIKVREAGRVAELFDDLIRVGSGSRRQKSSDCMATFRYLLLKVEELTMSSERAAGGAQSAYLKCRAYMTAHCVKLRSAGEAARACQIDQAYLCRLFKTFGEETPYQYLLRLRMEHAAARLRSESVSAQAVSKELGFADPAAFSRAFKRSLGVSPGRFR